MSWTLLIAPIASLMRWRDADSSNRVPSNLQPTGNQCFVVGESQTPFSQGKSFSIMGDQNIVASISSLLRGSRPSTVLWAVVPIVVNSVKGMITGGTRPHIGEKILKRIQPPITHRDTTTCVPRESIFFCGVAPIFHRSPSRMFSGIRHPVFGNCGLMLASTRFGFTLPQAVSIYSGLSTTGTQTKPPRASLSSTGDKVFVSTDDSPVAEGLPSKVNKFWHSALLNVKHLMVHGKQRCSCDSGATLAMQGGF